MIIDSTKAASPSLSLPYNSGAGNSIFGLGWSLGLPSIKRKTDKRFPQYFDSIDSDTFLFSEAEDRLTGYEKVDLDAIYTHLFPVFSFNNYRNILTWRRVIDCAEDLRKLGSSPARGKRIFKADPDKY